MGSQQFGRILRFLVSRFDHVRIHRRLVRPGAKRPWSLRRSPAGKPLPRRVVYVQSGRHSAGLVRRGGHLQRQYSDDHGRLPDDGRALDPKLRSESDREQSVGHAHLYLHRLQPRQGRFRIGAGVRLREHEPDAVDAASSIGVSVTIFRAFGRDWYSDRKSCSSLPTDRCPLRERGAGGRAGDARRTREIVLK